MKRVILSFLLTFFVFQHVFAEPKNADQPLASGPKPEGRPSVALVLAGGGAKGFAHLPVIEFIEELGIPIDMVVGTSIGSIIGGLYSAGYTPKEILSAFDSLDWTPLFLDSASSPYEDTLEDHSLESSVAAINFSINPFKLRLGSSLSNGQNVYQVLKELTIKYPSEISFDTLKIPFRAVVTDMLTGEAMVLDSGDLAEAIRASMSLPSVFAPAEIDGYHFMDGGIRYNLAINVAKNMGYDIIIAVDISQKVRDDPEIYSSNPAVAMLNTITISQYTATSALYKDADLVIFPDISKFGTLDFQKAKSIFNEGKKILPKYEESLEEIRRRIYPDDYDENGNRISERVEPKKRGTYRRKANLIPTKMEVEGAYEKDMKFLNRLFERVYDHELTPEVLQDFMENIYRTGKYESIRPRVFEEGDETILKLILKQKEQKEAKIVFGVDFEQSLSSKTYTSLDFSMDFQFRGLTGPGSLVALSGVSVNDFGASLYYMQPVTPNFFIQAYADVLDDRYPEMPWSIVWNNNIPLAKQVANYESFRTLDVGTVAGLRYDSMVLKVGPYFLAKETTYLSSLFKDFMYDLTVAEINEATGSYDLYDSNFGEEWVNTKGLYFSAKAFGGYVDLSISKLDRDGFAHKGVYVKFNTDLMFVFSRDGKSLLPPAWTIDLDFKAAIPIGKKFSINFAAFAGLDVLENTSKYARLLFFGYDTYDRVFFPQVTQSGNFGSKQIAAELALQFEPFGQLTIFGGNAIIRLSGALGNVFNQWSEFFPTDERAKTLYPLLWNSSLGFGLKVKNSFNIFLRVGAGSNYNDSAVEPFFAFDIGSILF